VSEKRIVVDTNVIVSGIMGGGPPGKIINAWLLGLISPVVSRELKREVNEVLQRSNIKKFIDSKGVKNIRASLGTLFNKALTVLPKPIDEVVFPDKDDHFLLELAITGDAVAIITGDKALQILSPVMNVQILSPEQFCRRFKLK
jgi:putative PIN family toxin of toxin-antitoxin system